MGRVPTAVDATFQVEQPGGALAPLKLSDVQVADPAAGPGALDASVQAVKASVDALRAQLATPIGVAVTGTVDVADRAARLLGHVTVDNLPATQPVSGTVDVSDRAARLAGHVSVDNFPATQPVSGNVDVSDRAARLLGHVTVDNAPALNADGGALAHVQNSVQVFGIGPAGTDGVTASTSVQVTPDVWNGATWDRMRGVSDNIPGTGIQASGIMGFDGTNYRSLLTLPGVGDGTAQARSMAAGVLLYNSATWDRARAVSGTAGQGTTGIAAVGALVTDGTNYYPLRIGLADGTNNALNVGNYVYNGASWDRQRSGSTLGSALVQNVLANGNAMQPGGSLGDANAALSTMAVGGFVFNGVNWDRQRAAPAAGGAGSTVGYLAAAAMGWDGTQYRALGSTPSGFLSVSTNPSTGANGIADGATGSGMFAVGSWVYNGASWDRHRAALGANVGTVAQAGDSLVVTGTGAALNATPIAQTDARAYRWVSVQITGTFVGTVTLQTSNDGVAWLGTLVGGVQAATAPTIISGPLSGRYFRATVTAYTSGTINATALFSAIPASSQFVGMQALDFTTFNSSNVSVGNVDALAPSAMLGSGGYGYNGGSWDRLRTVNGYIPNMTSAGLLAVVPMVGVGSPNYQPLMTANVSGINSDANGLGGALGTNPAIYGYNGATWDRLRTAKGDGSSAGATGILGVSALLSDGVSSFRSQFAASAVADAADGSKSAAIAGYEYNGASWDRHRNNLDGTALASAARTATTSSADLTNYNANGAIVILRVSAITTAPSLTVTVEAKDPVSGLYYALNATPAAVTAVGTYVYEVGAGSGSTATGAVLQRTAGQVPRTFRVTVTHGNANSVTYSVGYSLID